MSVGPTTCFHLFKIFDSILVHVNLTDEMRDDVAPKKKIIKKKKKKKTKKNLRIKRM
jgi:hypothetical protein